MRIVIIGPGHMPIPPTGWGAIESLIWDYKCSLEKDHEVLIVNSLNNDDIIKQTNDFRPDFVHVQYDDYWYLVPKITCPKKAITSHFAYLEQQNRHGAYANIVKGFSQIISQCFIFCLSESIKNYYLSKGFPENRLKVIGNGARKDLFNFTEQCQNPDKSLYLAKIDYRKRQSIIQRHNANVYFAGNIADNNFIRDQYYLGEWSKDYLYQNLTNYANLILLSDGEADPLVTKEALMAGLGLVISDCTKAGLDLNKPFIDIIPENMIHNAGYVQNVIQNNRMKSIITRQEIRNYGINNFDWSVVVEKYINIIQNI